MQAKLQTRNPTYMIDERRTEASNARSTGLPDTGKHNAVRAAHQKVLRQLLRRLIALWNGAGPEILSESRILSAEIMKLSGKVGEIVVTGGDLFEWPIDFSKLFDLVKSNLSD